MLSAPSAPANLHTTLSIACHRRHGMALLVGTVIISLANSCTGRFCHCCGPEHHKACPYLRVSFASATLADLSEGMARLGAVLRRFTSPPDSTAASSSAASDGVPASVFTSASSGAAHAGRAAAGGIRALDSAFELKGGAEGPAGRKAEGRSPTLCLSREGPGEVVPDCRAKVELVSGSAAVSEDALAPLPAKTIAGIPATHLGA